MDSTYRMEINHEKLPRDFNNIIVDEKDNLILIRSVLRSMTDLDKWVEEFGRKTNTHWNTRTSCPSGSRFRCSKYFVCHHSSYMKVRRVQNKHRVSKNYGCLATIKIKIKVDTRGSRHNDVYITQGYLGVIAIAPVHNHPLDTTETLKFLPSAECRERFYEYFSDGMGVAQASRFHKEVLQMAYDFQESDLDNKRINPTSRTIRHWYEKWRHLPRGKDSKNEEEEEEEEGEEEAEENSNELETRN